jgi:hypothetical protein
LLPTFWYKLLVLSSRVKQPKKDVHLTDYLTSKTGPKGRPETSLTYYQTTLHKTLEKLRSHVHTGTRLKSCAVFEPVCTVSNLIMNEDNHIPGNIKGHNPEGHHFKNLKTHNTSLYVDLLKVSSLISIRTLRHIALSSVLPDTVMSSVLLDKKLYRTYSTLGLNGSRSSVRKLILSTSKLEGDERERTCAITLP